MKKSTKNGKLLLLARICAIVCSVWTIVAGVLVIRSGGEMNPGYVAIPGAFSATFVAIVVGNRSRAEKRGNDDNENSDNSDNINKE